MSSGKRFAAALLAAALIPAAGAAQEPDFSGVYNFVEISAGSRPRARSPSTTSSRWTPPASTWW